MVLVPDMIIAYCGKPGSGKTYSMARDCAVAMNLGQDVWANFALNGARYFRDLQEIFNVEKGIIAIDELNTLMPANKWQSVKIEHLNLFTQSRKNDLDLLYTSQNFHRVVSNVRDITNYVWHFDWIIRPKFRRGAEPTRIQRFLHKWHKACMFEPADLDRIRAKPVEKYRFWEDKRVYKIYDTKFRIKTPEHLRGLASIEDLDPYSLPQFNGDLSLSSDITYAKIPTTTTNALPGAESYP